MHGMDDRTAARARVPRWVLPAVLLVGLAIIWHSLGDHPLYRPDEGRYGAVSAWMAEHGNWLQPRMRDVVHVTKPPLTYWAQAAAITALGRTELAVRLPSAVGASILLLALAWFARRTCGPLVAVLAVGLYAVMPLPVFVGRLGSTDALLAAWWWIALCAGWLAFAGVGTAAPGARRVSIAWLAVFWAASALVGLTKGPLILTPFALVCAWLVLAGRWRDVLRMQPWLGIPAALAPLAFVAWGYWQADPGRAAEIWRLEFLDRITTGIGRAEPWWYFVPIFLGGLFPASAMLTLPWLNVTWGRAWRVLRSGSLDALLVVAAVLPLVGFSAASGKLATYILPCAAPTALLAARMLARWVEGRELDRAPDDRLPDVRVTCTMVMALLAVGAPVLAVVAIRAGHAPAWAPGWTLLAWSLVFVPGAVGWLVCLAWWRRPEWRGPGLAMAFAGMACMWFAMHGVEDRAMGAMGSRPVESAIRMSGRPVMVCALPDLTIDFYRGDWLPYEESTLAIPPWFQAHPDGMVLMTDDTLAMLVRKRPEIFAMLRVRESFPGWPLRTVHLVERVPGVAVPGASAQ